MTVVPATQISLTLEALSEPIAGSYRTGCGESGRFRGLLELVGVLERVRSEAVATCDENGRDGRSSSRRCADMLDQGGERPCS